MIYASMNVARKRKYAEREKLFADALARFDEYRKENKMNIRFTDDIHKALIERANREDKSAAALVSELITAVLKPRGTE